MSNVRLPKAQELDVLSRLSTDDGYRARFENDPVSALKEAGVGDADIARIDPANLKPGKLADKATIAATRDKLADASVSDHVCLIIPMLRTNYGKAD
ncbi:MAG: NHLP-related RiPP peptide [Xanthomonadales bacterium]|nr:NHLP-related RiPP peptide [Xanthomonadales bacterium]